MHRGKDVQKRGVTILEVIVAMAILAIAIGLILAGINIAREAAVRTQNQNNLRQIILSTLQLAGEKEERITDITKSSMKGVSVARQDCSIYYRLLPYLIGKRESPRPPFSYEAFEAFNSPKVTAYRNPADPTWDCDPNLFLQPAKISYAYNMIAFDTTLSLIGSLPDGSSQTVAFADKYYAKCSSNGNLAQTMNNYNHLFDPLSGEIYGLRRATFADRGWEDVLPVTDLQTRTSKPSVAGKLFQTRPTPENVDPHILQTAFTAGLTVALFDGSVRTLRPSIDETVFWAMITPNGGEVISLD